MKNIPSRKEYIIGLTHSTKEFVNNLRWRVKFHLNPNKQKDRKETYGLKSTNHCESDHELAHFEDKLFERGMLETLFIIHRAKLLLPISPHPMNQQRSPCCPNLLAVTLSYQSKVHQLPWYNNSKLLKLKGPPPLKTLFWWQIGLVQTSSTIPWLPLKVLPLTCYRHKYAHNIGPPGPRSLPPSDLKTC